MKQFIYMRTYFVLGSSWNFARFSVLVEALFSCACQRIGRPVMDCIRVRL